MAIAILASLAVGIASPTQASTERPLLRAAPASNAPSGSVSRPPNGQKVCMLGDDRECGPRRGFGPWREEEAPQSPACTEHFCVHWVVRTGDAPHPDDVDGDDRPFETDGVADNDQISDFVEEIAVVAEHSYAVMVDRLGWQPPLPDHGKGGDDRTDIYLFNTDKNTRAAALALSDGQEGAHPRHRSGWMILDDDYDDPQFHGDAVRRVLEYYVPHELHHIVQSGYDMHMDGWLWEATAEWMSSRVYPHPQFYAFTGALATTSTQPLHRYGYRSYSLMTWNSWLASRLGPEVVRKVWERGDRFPRRGRYSVEIFDRVIGQLSNGSSSFADEFVRYAAATAEWSTGDFESGNHFGDISREGTLQPGGPAVRKALPRSSWALYDINIPPGNARSYRLSVDVDRGKPAGIALVGSGGNQIHRSITIMRSGGVGKASLRVPGSGLDRLTAVLVNARISPPLPEGEGRSRFVARVERLRR